MPSQASLSWEIVSASAMETFIVFKSFLMLSIHLVTGRPLGILMSLVSIESLRAL